MADSLVESAAVVLGVAVLVVVAGSLAVATLGADDGPTVDADSDANTTAPPSEYDPEAVVIEPFATTGQVAIDSSLHATNDTDRKVVVIDQSSRVVQEDVRPLVEALTLAGHEVRYVSGDVNESLRDADAYVRIDPGQSMDRGQIAGVKNFTDSGGRVLLVAEPNRIEVSATIFSTSLTTVRTAMVELGAEYGLVFGNRYLYDTTVNDGNFKNVLARPTNASAAPALETVALSTATHIDSRNGTVLLRTPPSTRLSNQGENGSYAVAVRTGNVLALGDGTFLHDSRHTIADNELFVGHVAEFLVSGERTETTTPAPEPGTENETDTSDETTADNETATDNETAPDNETATDNETASDNETETSNGTSEGGATSAQPAPTDDTTASTAVREPVARVVTG